MASLSLRAAACRQVAHELLRQFERLRQVAAHAGLFLFNYFNVSEFGYMPKWPPPPCRATKEEDLWKDPNDYLFGKLRSGLWMPKGHPVGDETFIMDPGDPVWRDFLLEQAQRHLDRLPDTDGLAIDRMDLVRHYNPQADDGITWMNGRPARAFYFSWQQLMAKLGAMMHNADKAIILNNHTKRLDLMRDADGIYCEFGYSGTSLNASSLLCVRKPLMLWTDGPMALEPEPDAYFQRHLYLGGYPTAPYPGNNHCIKPGNNRADKFYLDYGPLLDAMRGKKWVLLPHVIEVADQKARANLFSVPGGYVIPVTFGGKDKNADIVLSGLPTLPGQDGFRVEVIHPGQEQWSTMATISASAGQIKLRVPLERGCAMVKLAHVWIDPKTTWFHSTANAQIGTTIAKGEIRYTLDGTQPTTKSLDGGNHLQLSLGENTTVHAAIFAAGKRVGDVVTSEFVRLPLTIGRASGAFHAPYGPLDTGAGRAGGAFHAPYGLELWRSGPAAPCRASQ